MQTQSQPQPQPQPHSQSQSQSLSHSQSPSPHPHPAAADSSDSPAVTTLSPPLHAFYPPIAYFNADRHQTQPQQQQPDHLNLIQRDYKPVNKSRTAAACLVLCLNLGVEPPDSTGSAAAGGLSNSSGLCWLTPELLLANPTRSLELVGSALQSQYEVWQPKSRYRLALDPTHQEVKLLSLAARKSCKSDRILFHFNGFGVPRPTSNGELWLFNRNYTQYIPLSIVELHQWIQSPALYIFDCNSAGILIEAFEHFSKKNREKSESVESTNFNASQNQNQRESVSGDEPPSNSSSSVWRDTIILAGCSSSESLPRHPSLPADLFTACLTTPLKVALRWFCLTRHSLVKFVSLDLIDQIPGKIGDRKTPLGELNWIFTAITDTIAWHSLPRDLFQTLFRGDLMLGSLFRNYLLAERIFKSFDCSPQSIPAMPDCSKHFLWSSFDSIMENFLLQLDKFLKHSIKFSHSSFFAEHLSAFEVWLEVGREENPPPLQLPIVLQVLLSQNHRRRALVLLARFLGKGSWAVHEALGVGILPYVLKLLQSPAAELREVLVFIWTKILSVAKNCQSELLKDNNYQYFVSHLADSRVAERQRVMSAFVLASLMNEFPEGQTAILADPKALSIFSVCLESDSPNLRRWICLCFAKFWLNHESGKQSSIATGVHERIAGLVADPIPEVRAACLHSMQCFMTKSASSILNSSASVSADQLLRDRHSIELQLAKSFAPIFVDASPLVRLELILALAALIEGQLEEFNEIAMEKPAENDSANVFTPSAAGSLKSNSGLSLIHNSRSITEPPSASHINRSNFRSPSVSFPSQSPQSSIRSFLWRIVRALCHDPFPSVSRAALTLRKQVINRTLGSKISEVFSPSIAPNSPEQAIIEGLTSMGLMDFSLVDGPQSFNQSNSHIAQSANQISMSLMMPPSPAGPKLLTVKLQSAESSDAAPTRSRADAAMKRVSSFGSFAEPMKMLPASNNIIPPVSPSIGRSSLSIDNSQPLNSIYNPINSSTILEESAALAIPSFLPPSTIFDRSCDYFSAPQQDPIVNPSDSLTEILSRDWRNHRNSEILQAAAALPTEVYDVNRSGAFDQSAVIQCGLDSVSALLFHPFENLLVCGDSKRSLSVWDYVNQEKINQFSNDNSRGSKLSSLRFINESMDRSLLLAGSDDGVVRIWKNIHEKDSQTLVTAWLAVRNLQRGVYPGLIIDWQPAAGRLIASGNTDTIRVCDVEREICIAELTWEDFGESIFPTSITSSADGNSLFAGFIDGAMRNFDLRASESIQSQQPQSFSGSALPRHSSPVVGLHLQRGGWNAGRLLSAALNREIHIVDLRFSRSDPHSSVHRLTGFDKSIPLDCFVSHDFAPLFACGSRSQMVRIADQTGSTVSSLKFHKGFMGHRIGPVTAMAFHPTKLLLASASVNPLVSVMSATGSAVV